MYLRCIYFVAKEVRQFQLDETKHMWKNTYSCYSCHILVPITHIITAMHSTRELNELLKLFQINDHIFHGKGRLTDYVDA